METKQGLSNRCMHAHVDVRNVQAICKLTAGTQTQVHLRSFYCFTGASNYTQREKGKILGANVMTQNELTFKH